MNRFKEANSTAVVGDSELEAVRGGAWAGLGDADRKTMLDSDR